MKILITTSSFGKIDASSLEYLRERVEEVVLNPYGRKLTREEVSALVSDLNPDGLIAGVEPLTGEVLKKAKNLKVISRAGIGMDNVDTRAAEDLGINVYNTPEGPSRAVSELTVGLMLAALRRISEADQNIREDKWGSLMGRLLGKQTVGIIGYGRIGSRVAALVKSFGAKVLVYDPFINNSRDVELVNFNTLLSKSDITTLHVPYNKETHHMIDEDTIKKMKKDSVLINTARGGLVDEDALYKSLKSCHLSGAAVDTFEEEPYKGPLRELPSVVMTSHMGSYARESRVQMEWDAVENLLKGLRL